MILRQVLLVSVLLLTATTARALTIVGYDPAVNDRFSSGYPGTPVENSSLSFLGAGYDLSGVGWNTSNNTQSFAMISDQYFVYSNHFAPGSSMSFLSPTLGTVVTYGVSGTRYNFTYNGQTSDFAIGMLTTPISAGDGIASYPILDLAQVSDYLGLPALIYGRADGGSSPVLGATTVDLLLPFDFPGSPAGNDTFGVGYSYNSSQPGDSFFQGGDSSGPTFVSWYGQLALLGTHSVVTNGSTPYSIDNLIAIYTDQMTAQGLDFSAVPEPSRALLLLIGACALLRRRHRVPSQA